MVRVQLRSLGDLRVDRDNALKRGDVVAEIELPSEEAVARIQGHMRAGRIVMQPMSAAEAKAAEEAKQAAEAKAAEEAKKKGGRR